MAAIALQATHDGKGALLLSKGKENRAKLGGWLQATGPETQQSM